MLKRIIFSVECLYVHQDHYPPPISDSKFQTPQDIYSVHRSVDSSQCCVCCPLDETVAIALY